MRIRRIMFSITLVISLCIPIPVFAVSDISGHWAEGAINNSIANGYISGYKDGTFRPNATVSRAEFVTLANRCMHLSGAGNVPFIDVLRNDWFYNDVSTAVRHGYISGYNDHTFRPNNVITREMASVIASNLLHLKPDEKYASYFTDSYKLTYSKGAVGAAVKANIISGYTDGEFKPERSLTRAEAVVIINRVAAKRFDENLDYQSSFQNYYTNQSIFDWSVPEDRLNYESSGLTASTNLNSDDYYRMFNGNYGTDKVEEFKGSIYYDPTFAGTVKNITVNGDFNISSLVSGERGLTLENVIIRGKLVVYGVNEITLKNCEINEIEYISSSGYATITAQGASSIFLTRLYKGAKLAESSLTSGGFREVVIDKKYKSGDTAIISGDYMQLNILGSNADISLENGIFENVAIGGSTEKTEIEIKSTARVKFLDVAASCYIGGVGKIDHARIMSADAVFDLIPQNLSGNEDPVYTSTAHTGNYTDDYAKELYPVILTITDLNGIVKPGVSVTLGGYGEFITGYDGKVTFPYVNNGIYTVAISSPNVKTAFEEITVKGAAVNKTIAYDSEIKYNAVFSVKFGGLPVSGAEVNFNGISQFTSSSGYTEFIDFAPGFYTYVVTYQNMSKNGVIDLNNMNQMEPVNFP